MSDSTKRRRLLDESDEINTIVESNSSQQLELSDENIISTTCSISSADLMNNSISTTTVTVQCPESVVNYVNQQEEQIVSHCKVHKNIHYNKNKRLFSLKLIFLNYIFDVVIYYYNISNVAVSSLLSILKSHQSFKTVLSKDARTILQTSVSSSESSFWPIICYIRPYKENVFPIGIYWGYKKPLDSNEFLTDFCEEITNSINNGIQFKIDNQNVVTKKVILDTIVCDSPAKSFVLKIKGHARFFSCTKCETEGQYMRNRLSLRNYVTNDFPRKPRSLDEFSNWKATEFRLFVLYTGPVISKTHLSHCNKHVKRYKEQYNFNTLKTTNSNNNKYIILCEKQHHKCPLLDNLINPQYHINTNSERDSYISTKSNEIIKVINICSSESRRKVIVGYTFLLKNFFFIKPIDSIKFESSEEDLNSKDLVDDSDSTLSSRSGWEDLY
ncbi:hypothetical protein QTP88_028641 [Uroleucon formosanum]